jgi:hypothetical protein
MNATQPAPGTIDFDPLAGLEVSEPQTVVEVHIAWFEYQRALFLNQQPCVDTPRPRAETSPADWRLV